LDIVAVHNSNFDKEFFDLEMLVLAYEGCGILTCFLHMDDIS